ncbi:MAG: hypothetical protein KC964_28955 [Candidatus Omnitrophica bacterium]|nr:hypothetical protein [Candidatus Omnitrophota bacterium]
MSVATDLIREVVESDLLFDLGLVTNMLVDGGRIVSVHSGFNNRVSLWDDPLKMWLLARVSTLDFPDGIGVRMLGSPSILVRNPRGKPPALAKTKKRVLAGTRSIKEISIPGKILPPNPPRFNREGDRR